MKIVLHRELADLSMQLPYSLRRFVGLLGTLAEDIRCVAQQLLLPIGDLVGMDIELLDQLGHRQITLYRRQGYLGFELGRMVPSLSSHCFSPERIAHDGGNTYLRPITVQSGGSSSLKRMKELEAENAKLKRMYADKAMEADALRDLIEKKL